MKVAIIGAGLAGLSCAYELQKQGFMPDIFEKTTLIGENMELPVILLRMFETPIRDPIKFLKKEFGMQLIPHYIIVLQKLANKTNSLSVWLIERTIYAAFRFEQEDTLFA